MSARSARPSGRCSTDKTASLSDHSNTRRDIGRRRRSASPGARRRCWDRTAFYRSPVRQRSMLGRCGIGASLLASAWMPMMKPGRVTRRDIIFGSWQSMQETGCAFRQSERPALVAWLEPNDWVVGIVAFEPAPVEPSGVSSTSRVRVDVAHRAHPLESFHHRRPGKIVHAHIRKRLALRFQPQPPPRRHRPTHDTECTHRSAACRERAWCCSWSNSM